MKKFADVEKTRIAYHKDGTKNSCHRASLLVPEIDGLRTEISFVNHFLLKREYTDVGCRVTGLDSEGKRIEANLIPLTDPKVYTMDLTNMFEGKASNYMVEFFSGKNIFIPFPAVMVNHYGDGFVNTVHAYNRVLNDIFEDDAINASHVSESSIDVLVNEQFDTFVTFQAGTLDCQGSLDFELFLNGEKYKKTIPLDVKRFCSKRTYLSEIFSDLKDINGGVLKVTQPTQTMFYGRLLIGIEERSTKSFSGNHSYYDTSSVSEYWEENIDSRRLYPFINNYENIIRMYPIQSEGTLNLSAKIFGKAGEELGTIDLGQLESPSDKYLESNLTSEITKNNLDPANVGAVELIAGSNDKIPMRINHQLVFMKDDKSLFSSINLSLLNSQVFQRKGKKAFSWGQMIHDEDNFSKLGIVFNSSEGEGKNVSVNFYDADGLFCTKEKELNAGESLIFDTEEDSFYENIQRPIAGRNIWYTVSSDRPDITGIVVTTNKKTGHTTGEHSY